MREAVVLIGSVFVVIVMFFLGYCTGRKDERKEQEKIAIQAGMGYYSVDQESGTVKFKYNF